MNVRLRRFALVFIVVLLLPIAATGGLAQSGPMRFLVGLAAGGAVDPYARVIADEMSKLLGETIIVENKPGAGGNISAQYMIEQPANGRLLWVSTMALTEINPFVYSNLRWSIDQFTPIIKGVQAPLVFVAHPSVPANSLAEFVAWAKPIAASSAIRPTPPARRRTFSAFSSTRNTTSTSPTFPTAARACR